jgi:transcriptional regulator with XRE-family HTH domain
MPSPARSNRPDPALARVLREEREKQGKSQEDLAHEAKITTGSLARIERSKTNPAWGTVRRITAALGISLVELAKRIEKHERK